MPVNTSDLVGSVGTLRCRLCGFTIMRATDTLEDIVAMVRDADAEGWTLDRRRFAICPRCSGPQQHS